MKGSEINRRKRKVLITCKGGKTGRKLHLAHPKVSVTRCGCWLMAKSPNFQVNITDNDVIQDKDLCEKCFNLTAKQ